MRSFIAPVVVLGLLLSACAGPQDTVVFATRTSLGVDVENVPPSASFGYGRDEGYFGHRFADGNVPPVAGSFSTKGGIFDRKVQQVYATGPAALIVTNQANSSTSTERSYSGEHKPMFFATSTTLGFKVMFGEAMNSMTLGYKRKEASIIPLVVSSTAAGAGTVTFPSVIASVGGDVVAGQPSTTTFAVSQYFATGAAAENVAGYASVRSQFRRQAEDAIAQYRSEELAQSAAVLDTVYCLSEVPDAKLPQVWKNAEELQLFSDKAVYTNLNSKSPFEARSIYTRYVTIVDPASATRTGLLAGHRAYVCNLRS
jgi:hypothetical protein